MSSASPRDGAGCGAPALDFLTPAEGGVRLVVRVVPRSGRGGGMDMAQEADGRAVLRVAVAAPPVEGRANAALLALVAKTCGVPKSAVALVSGATGRRKTLFIAGDAAALGERLRAAIRP